MIRLVARRVVGAVVVLWTVATLSFFAMRAAPGGPFDRERQLSAEVKRNIERRYRLDRPVFDQYVDEMGRLARGDLGQSMRRPYSVVEIIAQGFPRSLALGLAALALATAGGLALGVVAAARRGSWVDRAAMAAALVGVSVPAFVLGPLLIQWLSLRLGWFPAARLDGPAALVLPATTLALVYAGAIARLARGGLVDALAEDWVRTARAKGLGEAAVIGRHALRVAILPVLAYLGPVVASLVTGSIVVESIFEIPGLGFSFVASVQDRDAPVLVGVTVFYCAIVLVANFAVDIAGAALDPRSRAR
jgi:oligopeptide transport system permease protein